MFSVLVTAFALLDRYSAKPRTTSLRNTKAAGDDPGNCMTGIALGLNTLTTSLMLRRASVEAQLMLGATRGEVGPCNSQCAAQCVDADHQSDVRITGLVSLPELTGQTMSTPRRGSQIPDPGDVPDCGWQQVAGAVAAVLGGVGRLTDARHRLRLGSSWRRCKPLS